MNTPSIQLYHFHTVWSEEDQLFVGLCSEFPSLSWLDTTQDRAKRGIQRVVEDVLQDMSQNGEQPPVPQKALD